MSACFRGRLAAVTPPSSRAVAARGWRSGTPLQSTPGSRPLQPLALLARCVPRDFGGVISMCLNAVTMCWTAVAPVATAAADLIVSTRAYRGYGTLSCGHPTCRPRVTELAVPGGSCPDAQAHNPPEAALAALITVWAISSASLLGRSGGRRRGFRHHAEGANTRTLCSLALTYAHSYQHIAT